ncbi:fish-egg lectin-like isoform X1 [Oncorhynchus mykiss]|uniref:fish-egg lectin isoform X2 n=1 Tax=Oncorhynchus mykiss TaxID=8022 RepID=UPI001877C657|nr:fish-egg lectin isoform X2 [Oncorhynchus mykiss]XP_036801044.1 fish-egg lectin-like isoform X1 [Oncorhynchus mykiss]
MRTTAAVLLVLCLLTISHAWDCQEIVAIKNLMQIDAGLGQVVATDTSQTPYYLVGNEWIRLPGSLRHITVGPTGIWGVSNGNLMFKYVAGNWVQFATGVNQLDAGEDQFVVVANMDYVPGCLSRSASLGFMGADSSLRGIRLPGAVKYSSCGHFGCWAVNKNDDIYLMSLNQDCQNNGWRHIDGKLSMIEVATDGSVFGVNSAGQVYTRDGITASKPEGTGWSNVPMYMPMKHVTYDLGRLWVISNSGFTMVCTH